MTGHQNAYVAHTDCAVVPTWHLIVNFKIEEQFLILQKAFSVFKIKRTI